MHALGQERTFIVQRETRSFMVSVPFCWKQLEQAPRPKLVSRCSTAVLEIDGTDKSCSAHWFLHYPNAR